ncbi:MAG: threonine--tRNA ligase [Actinobacteria bacterium]|uniref:threonine--tRNA ligase n=1 Tax=freshwater metagenome TaxID=449393 RepID=A0A6J6A872_9ZZZZ|nr:threonine--tRNA ligase [Actinomycetota bacterium]MSW79127.1 threonine--tRNA ligase [Actinomycetota bacterium]MSX56919.1 threonine--tRNA ligase [Actinomycetota bacterium]MSX93523.1 threonine--tRNA ligase [Actinomycetota bacterium]MSZ84958.1 threonine--tRNA ligase [Actinomycetota bacterium]
MAEITISLPDGSQRSLPEGATATTLAESIGRGLAKAAVAAVVNGEEADLGSPLPADATVAIITAESDAGRHVLRHSTAHVLAQAVIRLFPGAKYSIGPAINDGFYYDFELPGGRTFTEGDLASIDAEMRVIIKADQPFVRAELPAAEALQVFAGQPYKCEIIERVSTGAADNDDTGEIGSGETISVYRNTPEFVDLCRGPHVPSTSKLGHFKLMKVAGAYWRGNEKAPMLQRIYGTAWESKASLDEHLHRLEEAEKRDHRKLAVELDLLSFPTELGGGLAVWHPKGAIVRKLMEDYSRERHANGGYQFVFTPHLSNAALFETSGHLGFYKDGMYPPMEMDNGTYYMKPMNCPMHCLIFKSRQRSYRELPLRLFELGNVYRYERAGTLHGLMRIRGFTQDDSHIFCMPEQAAEEIASLLDFVMSVLRAFGFNEFTANLSTKDPNKYVGDDDAWDDATDALRAALEKYGLPYKIKEGDAAFYGPKIDIDVQDAIGRKWQLSTIQYDFNMAERFGLEYVGTDSLRHRPIMLHRALFGSVERFFGVLLEHYAGAFPTWMAPLQARVLPVATAHQGYAEQVVARLQAEGFRVDLDGASDQLGKRIRTAKMEKTPYVLVVGDDDVAGTTLGVNPRGGEVERGVGLDEFVARLHAEVDEQLANV